MKKAIFALLALSVYVNVSAAEEKLPANWPASTEYFCALKYADLHTFEHGCVTAPVAGVEAGAAFGGSVAIMAGETQNIEIMGGGSLARLAHGQTPAAFELSLEIAFKNKTIAPLSILSKKVEAGSFQVAHSRDYEIELFCMSVADHHPNKICPKISGQN